MHKAKPLDPAEVVTPPPWEREEIHYKEVPAVIKREYGITYHFRTVYNWTHRGLDAGDGKRMYLPAHKIAGLLFVRLVDLKAFLKQARQ